MRIETLVGGPLANNTYLVVDETSGLALVIDPALSLTPRIVALARERGWSIALIVATHQHWDHVAEIAALAAATGAPVAAHQLDASAIAQPSRPTYFPGFEVPAATVDRLLGEGDVLETGALRLGVLHTPGHTPGGICLYVAAQATLFSGDTLFAGSYGRTDLPGGDERALSASLRRLAALPPPTLVLPGHGPATTIGRESWLPRELRD